MRLKKHEYKQITLHYILAAIINPMIFGFMKNKIGLVNDRSM